MPKRFVILIIHHRHKPSGLVSYEFHNIVAINMFMQVNIVLLSFAFRGLSCLMSGPSKELGIGSVTPLSCGYDDEVIEHILCLVSAR